MKRIFGPALAAAALLVATSALASPGGPHGSTGHGSTGGGHGSPSHGHVSGGHGHFSGGHGQISGGHGHLSPSHGSWHTGWHGGGHGGWHSGWRWSWGWGWGWRDWGWGWGWGWGWAYPGYYGYGYGYGAPYGSGYAAYAPGEWGAVKTDVSPEEARVYLDGSYIGTADDFDGYPDFLYLKPGKYRLEFRLEGFETQSVDIDARPGVKLKLDNKLRKIPGAKQYGSYDTPALPGGLQRFFGKEKDKTTAINVQADRDADRDYDSEANASREGDWRDRGHSEPPSDVDPESAPEPPSIEPPPAHSEADRRPGSFSRSKARIVFRVEPADAAVYVDDRFAGTGEELSSLTRGLQVPPGMHKIVVSRPGFGTESTQVDTSAGRSETVEITLDRR